MLTARPYERRKSAMIARIGLLERVSMMREFRDKVLDLHEEFWEILTEKLAPYDERNYKTGFTAEETGNHSKPYDDKDAPLIAGIFNALDEAYDELDARCGELEAEEDAQYEAQEMFYAWEIGLCPYAMREYRRKQTPYVWNSLNWDDVAKHLSGSGMSRKDTDNAVREYLKDKDPDGDRVMGVTRTHCRV